MSIHALEKEIWAEAKVVFCNPKLRLKDIMEWSTSKNTVEWNLQNNEVMAEVLDFWVAINKKHDKRPTKRAGAFKGNF